ncbi:hypothetical protein LCGC14_0262340 [marine sediment metagenome]|uniref:Uncharacterized protein n=1 Tax=marine sediment metagenome TaxID=412755 RepID=A0A0F9U152_9ZZZZ
MKMGPMKKKCEIIVWFTLTVPEDVAGNWSDAELKMVLEEDLKHWAASVDGKFNTLYILINKSKPTSP